MKVIFLDFDGVLVTVHDRYTAGSPFCVFNLNRIIEATGAKIVVSSSWRILFEMEELTRFLKEWGVQGEVIGKTPVNHDGERGDEIQAWLNVEFELLSDEIKQVLTFLTNVNTGWDSDRPARRKLTQFFNLIGTQHNIPTIVVPDEGYV